ncbi:putative transcriptional activator [Microbacterium sp. TS-1]|nr:putative transcriptional activator [Microbacterium sp. TS-1]
MDRADDAEDLARLWPGMTSQTRNAVLRRLVARIEVRPAKHHGERAQRWRLVPAWEADADETTKARHPSGPRLFE